MVRMTWHESGKQFFETGVDRGVFYPKTGVGVPWNGLLSVKEDTVGGGVTPYYFDGVKYYDFVAGEDFQATVEAFSAPKEFSECDGLRAVVPGLYATNQRRKTFDFSYRTLIGNDVDYENHAYNLHLVYNVTAASASRDHSTIVKNAVPNTRSWTFHTVPVITYGNRPTAHLIIDSRDIDPFLLADLENRLYGSPAFDPHLPAQGDIANLFSNMITEPITEPI